MPYKVFVAGEEALAADANTYLMSQTVPRFTNATQRTSQLTAPALGQMSYREDVKALELYEGTKWIEPGRSQVISLPAHTNITTIVTINGSGWTLPSTTRRYLMLLQLGIFKGSAPGAVTIALSGPGMPTVAPLGSGLMTTPEGKSLAAAWSIPGTVGGGSLSAAASAGTVNIDAGSQIIILDVGSI